MSDVVHDRAPDAPRVTLPFKSNLGADKKLSYTDDGFLLCREVALSRTGEQVYAAHEVPDVEPGPDGMVVIERRAEDVFDPAAIASFAGKPFTDEHPAEDVSPENFRDHLVGVIQNPRRGDGERCNLMLGDVIVYSQPVIDAILSGKREVSCGYSTTYQKIGPGRGRQTAIVGNHVSLVDRGRAGPICSILDHAAALETVMTQVAQKARDSRAPVQTTTRDKAGWLAKIRDAFTTKDEDAFEAAMAEAPEGGDGSTVVVNVNQAAPDDGLDPATVAAMKTDPPAPAPTIDEGAPDVGELIKSALAEALGPLNGRLDKIEARFAETEENVEAIAEETGVDVTSAQDAMSRAVILAPDIQFPTRDSAARPGSRAARDHAVSIMRKGLTEGAKTADGAAAIRAVLPGVTDFAALSAGEVAIAFRAASDRVRDANNAKRGNGQPFVFAARDGKNPLASINERNRAARAALTGK